MANYNTTICYIFDTAENVKKIFSQIIDENESEKLLDMGKIHPVPEKLSLDDKKKWMIENWGNFFYTMFEYEIYDDFSKIKLEGRWSVFPKLFENLSINFSVPVLVKYYTEGNCGTGMRFLDPNKKIEISCDVPDDSLLNISAINFQALGVSQNVFSVFNKKNPLEVGGCMVAKERRRRMEESKEWKFEEKIEFKKEKNNVTDGDW